MLKYKSQLKKIFQKIIQADNILMVGHKRPDGDCLGAICALGYYFDSIGKKHKIFDVDQIHESFNYLACINKITNDISKIKTEKFDLILVLDTSSLDHSGIEEYLQKAKQQSFLINIDHHPTNTNFANLNLVIDNASSTSEIIFHLFKYNKIYIEREVATSLLAGIIADSGGFSNAATTISSIDAASYLLTHGGRLPKIVKNTYQNQSLPSLKLWGTVLARLEKNKKYDITYTYITPQDLEKYKVDDEAISGIANFLNNLEDSKAMMFIKEKTPGEISISMRTTNDLIDLAKLAKIVGGGGHRKAAGFSVNGKIVEEDGGVRVE